MLQKSTATAFDTIQEEYVSVVSIDESTIPPLLLVEDQRGQRYLLTEDDCEMLEAALAA